MATIFDLQDRGLRYGVIVDAAATTASLADLERAGLRYKVEVASGVTAADRAILDRRGLQYFVPVAVGVTAADKAALDRQGLRYAVQVDADILPADRAALEQQGLSYFVEVDSSGNSVAAGAAGGAGLLVDETNGFATDFTHAVDAERVAVKTAGTVVPSGLDAFYQNAGTSPKQVFDVTGALVWSPHNMLLQSADFTSASWAKTGTLNETAHTLTDNDAGIVEFVAQSVTVIAGAQYTVSTWFLKDAVTSRFAGVALVSTNQLGTQINTSTGVITNDINTISGTAVVEDTGTHWKLKQTVTAVSTSIAVRVYPARDLVFGGTSGGNVAAVGTVTIDRMQFNRGAVPTEHLVTTTAARYGLALDYDPVTHAAKGLLCEPAATNLVIQSAAPATQGVTVTAAAHTLSFFGTGTLTLTGTSTAGPLVGTGANNRVSLTFTPTAGTLTLTKSGTVTNAQLQTGTVASSYIPTLAATVTRAADVIKVTPASIGYSATAGSWWLDLSLNAFVSGAGRIICNRTGSNTPLFTNTTTQFGLYDGVAFITRSVGSVTGSHKLAAAFQSADRAITADALTVITDTQAGTALLSPGVDIGIGCDPNGVDQINGYIRKLRYVPRRKSNAELVTETT